MDNDARGRVFFYLQGRMKSEKLTEQVAATTHLMCTPECPVWVQGETPTALATGLRVFVPFLWLMSGQYLKLDHPT
jgi:hypothetical protein